MILNCQHQRACLMHYDYFWYKTPSFKLKFLLFRLLAIRIINIMRKLLWSPQTDKLYKKFLTFIVYPNNKLLKI